MGRRLGVPLTALLVATSAAQLVGQTQTDQKAPAIEVASVKPNTTKDTRISAGYSQSGLFHFTNYPLRALIDWAYTPVPWSHISGGPAWINVERFDIVVKLEGPKPTVDQLRITLRSLLMDRFKFVAHTETREGPIYQLVRARPDGRLGEHMRPVAVDCSLDESYRLPPQCLDAGFWPGLIAGGAMTMPLLADTLRDAVEDHREVRDRTGLTGAFAVDLRFRPDEIRPATALDPPDIAKAIAAIDPNGPSLFTALEEQLGLKLEPKKEPIDFVVIEHVERPTLD
jgi:uncharacterized protein (TIGR03435 family)